MSDEKNQESDGQESVGGLPTPTFSAESRGSTSDADALVSKLLDQLTPKLEDLIARKVQSTKDKRVDKIEKVLGGRLDLLAELEGEGVAVPKEVRNELRMRELEERLNNPTAQPVPGKVDGSTDQGLATAEAVAELKKYNLDPNESDFIQILRGQYPSKEAFDAKLQRYILGKVAPKQPPSPAGFTQAPATGGATPQNVETLTKQYQTEMRNAPRGQAGNATRNALKEQFRKQGVPVDAVDFT